MKMIVAYIKEHMLENVTLALHKIDGLTGMSIADYKGFGRSRGGTENEERLEDGFDFLPCIKIEITCENELVEKIVHEIQTHAHTGLRRDGKIYVLPVDNAIRISTGAAGKDAI